MTAGTVENFTAEPDPELQVAADVMNAAIASAHGLTLMLEGLHARAIGSDLEAVVFAVWQHAHSVSSALQARKDAILAAAGLLPAEGEATAEMAERTKH